MAKPNLALIPAAQGSKLFSVLPSSGVGDFDFTRSSSATRINSQGLIETVASGVSRLNYPLIDGKVVGCPHHLLEPVATNEVPYSEDFSQSAWTKLGTSIIPNSIISPNGTLNASRYQGDGLNSTKFLYDNTGSVVNGNTYTMSVFVKKGTLNYCQIFFGSATFNNALYSNFDLENGTIGSSGGGAIPFIEEYGNEWYRVGITANADADGSSTAFLCLANSSTMTRANVFTTSDYIYAYGFQVEQGSFPTSYIPTNGSTVTRSAETANNSGDASTFNDSEGVLMAEISALADDGTYRIISLSDGSAANSINIQYSNISNTIRTRIENGGAPKADISITSNVMLFNKISVLYKSNQFELWVNGFKVGEDLIGIPPSGINKLSFDRGDGLYDFYGSTKQIQYYDSALTDSELEQLTSWTSFSDMAEGQLYTIE